MSADYGAVKKRRLANELTTASISHKVNSEVPADRRNEILRYLMLFGYKPERTILQIHIAGFFNRKYRGAGHARRKPTTKRYGGTSFVVVGRYHDPKILEAMLRPKKKPDGASPGYMGYLWKGRNRGGKSPHELIPLDFTPMQISYPQDWKMLLLPKAL